MNEDDVSEVTVFIYNYNNILILRTQDNYNCCTTHYIVTNFRILTQTIIKFSNKYICIFNLRN